MCLPWAFTISMNKVKRRSHPCRATVLHSTRTTSRRRPPQVDLASWALGIHSANSPTNITRPLHLLGLVSSICQCISISISTPTRSSSHTLTSSLSRPPRIPSTTPTRITRPDSPTLVLAMHTTTSSRRRRRRRRSSSSSIRLCLTSTTSSTAHALLASKTSRLPLDETSKPRLLVQNRLKQSGTHRTAARSKALSEMQNHLTPKMAAVWILV